MRRCPLSVGACAATPVYPQLHVAIRYGIGAIAEGGHVLINQAAAQSVGAMPAQLEATIAAESRELARRVQAYRGGRSCAPVAGAPAPEAAVRGGQAGAALLPCTAAAGAAASLRTAHPLACHVRRQDRSAR